jgi:hypothetical protein
MLRNVVCSTKVLKKRFFNVAASQRNFGSSMKTSGVFSGIKQHASTSLQGLNNTAGQVKHERVIVSNTVSRTWPAWKLRQ